MLYLDDAFNICSDWPFDGERPNVCVEEEALGAGSRLLYLSRAEDKLSDRVTIDRSILSGLRLDASPGFA